MSPSTANLWIKWDDICKCLMRCLAHHNALEMWPFLLLWDLLNRYCICWGNFKPHLNPGIPEIQEHPVRAAQFYQPVAEDTQDHRRQVWNQCPVLLQLSEVASEVQHFLIHCDLQLHHNPSVYRGRKQQPPIHRTGIFHGSGKFSISLTERSPPRETQRHTLLSLYQTSLFFLRVTDGESGVK